MNFRIAPMLGVVVAGLTLITSSAFAQAPAGGPGAGRGMRGGGTRYEGAVSNVTSTGFTLTSRYGGKTVTVTTTPSTTYAVTADVGVAGLAVGNNVMIRGKIDDTTNPTAPTIDAQMIQISDRPFRARPNANAAANAARRGVMGSVTTTSPLTVTGTDGKVYAITTNPRTLVRQSQPGTASSVTASTFVNVSGTPVGDQTGTTVAITATRVDVMPAPVNGTERRGGRRNKNATANPAV